jgi:polyphosphate kinase
VDIDLIIRTICCLRPGVEGLSEHIRVRSIVGRFLEHSRIFSFGGADGHPARLLVGSADLWQRNLDRRIEVVVPVDEPEPVARLQEILELNLADDTNAWELGADGAWSRVPALKHVSTFQALQDAALEGARRRRAAEPLASSR